MNDGTFGSKIYSEVWSAVSFKTPKVYALL